MFQLRLLLLGSSDPLYGHWEQEELEIGSLKKPYLSLQASWLSYCHILMLTVSKVDMKISGFLSKCLSSCWERVKRPLWDCAMVESCFSNKSFVIVLLSWDIIADSFHVLITTQWDLKVHLKPFLKTKTKWNIFNFLIFRLSWISHEFSLVHFYCTCMIAFLRLR